MDLGLLVVLASVWSVSGQHLHYVLPDGSSPLNCPAQPCLTLDQYTWHTGTYFTTGSTFLFLAGNHSLQATVTLTNISDVTLRGEGNDSQVNIICKNGVTIQCDRITNLTIEKLTFLFYSEKISTSLNFSFCNDIKISGCLFQGGEDLHGRAITLVVSGAVILSSVFNRLLSNNGGAIHACNTNLTINASEFNGNRASLSGGAILYFVDAENAKIIVRGSRFVGNKAGCGGALLAFNTTITVSKSNFTGNRAVLYGGAVAITNITTVSGFGATSDLIVSGNKFIGDTARLGGAIYIGGKGQITLHGHPGNIFAHNSATDGGGAIYCKDDCTISITRNCNFQNKVILSETDIALVCSVTHFHNNTSVNNGGAIQLEGLRAFLALNGSNVTFTDNEAHRDGGAISVFSTTDCNVHLSGENILFEGNKAVWEGGAIYIRDCHALLDGRNIEFRTNMARIGGALVSESSELLTSAKSVKFIKNTAQLYGGAVAVYTYMRTFSWLKPRVVLICPCEVLITGFFANNSCSERGGAVYIKDRKDTVFYVTLQDITAVNNTGSAVCIDNAYVAFNGTNNLTSNTGRLGGGIYADNSVIIVEGHACLVDNKVSLSGGGIYSARATLSLNGDICLANNNAISGGGIYTVGGTLSLNGDMLFSHNTADRDGGALYATGTDITLNNRVNFTSNTAQNGGGMFISATTSLTVDHHTTLTTSHNHASLYGGAIYHEDKPTQLRICSNPKGDIGKDSPVCFLRLVNYREASFITSLHDSADVDGSFLYGGFLDKCILIIVDGTYNYSIIPFNFLLNNIINITSNQNNVNEIASMPYRLMFCDDPPHYYDKNVSVSRGQSFTISIQSIGITPVQVTALPGINARVHLNQVIRIASKKCANYSYNFYSSQDHDELRLTTRGSCGDNGTVQAVIRVTLLPCPHPFVQDNEECACDKRLLEYPRVDCTTDEYNNSYVTKTSGTDFWMSVSYNTNGSYEGLILYKTCPPQYCKTQTDVVVSLDNLDSQCDDNHGGVLCGQCLANYSLMLGSSKCRQCSNKHLALLLPFAAAGIALVVFLSFLRLTVATAMVNSVILYANILQAIRNFIFPVNARNVLTVFIAWMNLDLGFETCFYDGMTAYAQTWLQFAFPLYVWILISFIILSSRYSITLSKLIGHNPIAVLATLLLMSYTKLLKIIIEVYSSVVLDYPDNRTVTVWLKDANVPYLESWHLLLTVVTTLVLVLFFLPYTLLLLLGYKLYCFSGRKYFRWFHRMRPLLESYYAPYKIHTRYWTGFLLLVRCVLYIIFSFYSLENTNKSLLAINITFTALLVLLLVLLLCFSHQLYTKLHSNMMEISIYLNLIVISAATLAGVNSPALVYSLVGLVFVTMLGIIFYHFHLLYIVKSQVWQQFKVKVMSTLKDKLASTRTSAEQLVSANATKSSQQIVTHPNIELREPLL